LNFNLPDPNRPLDHLLEAMKGESNDEQLKWYRSTYRWHLIRDDIFRYTVLYLVANSGLADAHYLWRLLF